MHDKLSPNRMCSGHVTFLNFEKQVISRKWCKIETRLQRKANRNVCGLSNGTPLSVTSRMTFKVTFAV